MESRQSAFGFSSPLRQQPFPSLPLSPQTASGSVFWVLPLVVFYSSEKIKRFFLVKAFPRWYPAYLYLYLLICISIYFYGFVTI